MRAVVAQRAVSLGAMLVNDVSGGLADPDMFGYLAEARVPVVLMHWRGHSTNMQSKAAYPRGVVEEVCAEVGERIDSAVAAGVDPGMIVVDPGLGFAKEPLHNWELLHGFKSLRALGRPVLLGASRKRFLGELLSDDEGAPREMRQRDAATVAVSALAAAAGAWCVRVHDARGSADAVRVAAAWDGDRS
jgi:dihydropteroate synthase